MTVFRPYRVAPLDQTVPTVAGPPAIFDGRRFLQPPTYAKTDRLYDRGDLRIFPGGPHFAGRFCGLGMQPLGGQIRTNNDMAVDTVAIWKHGGWAGFNSIFRLELLGNSPRHMELRREHKWPPRPYCALFPFDAY